MGKIRHGCKGFLHYIYLKEPYPEAWGKARLVDTGEFIAGEILVAAKLAIGTERLRLFLTSERIIIARLGKRGAGELAATSLLGRFSATFEELFRGSRKSLKMRRARELTPDEILGLNKDNFQILNGNVVSINVEGSGNVVNITLLTRDDKLVFQTFEKLSTVLRTFSRTLSEKLVSRTTGP